MQCLANSKSLVVTIATAVVIMRHPGKTNILFPLFTTATRSERSTQPHPFTQMCTENVTMCLFVIAEDFIVFLLESHNHVVLWKYEKEVHPVAK